MSLVCECVRCRQRYSVGGERLAALKSVPTVGRLGEARWGRPRNVQIASRWHLVPLVALVALARGERPNGYRSDR